MNRCVRGYEGAAGATRATHAHTRTCTHTHTHMCTHAQTHAHTLAVAPEVEGWVVAKITGGFVLFVCERVCVCVCVCVLLRSSLLHVCVCVPVPANVCVHAPTLTCFIHTPCPNGRVSSFLFPLRGRLRPNAWSRAVPHPPAAVAFIHTHLKGDVVSSFFLSAVNIDALRPTPPPT